MISGGWYIGQQIVGEHPCSFPGWRHVLLKDENGHVAWRDVRKEWVR
jgi:hypothetical protein